MKAYWFFSKRIAESICCVWSSACALRLSWYSFTDRCHAIFLELSKAYRVADSIAGQTVLWTVQSAFCWQLKIIERRLKFQRDLYISSFKDKIWKKSSVLPERDCCDITILKIFFFEDKRFFWRPAEAGSRSRSLWNFEFIRIISYSIFLPFARSLRHLDCVTHPLCPS